MMALLGKCLRRHRESLSESFFTVIGPGTYLAIQFVVSLLNPSTPSQPASVHGSLGGNELLGCVVNDPFPAM